ncbi:TetR/AcrR family transcriptional regulator [Aquipuribacter nitratireducens]|uniref:TetR/AcrR family transcriptional regulator n=1 Tax=Aquipuribacter nitratireducens TaxID=650104 RepID=A0ABW0GU56_9MICO
MQEVLTPRRAPLTVERIVDTSRALLVEGGPEAVVVREVARRLEVTAPALYRHVSGRDDLLTLLIAACSDEATAAAAAGRDSVPAHDPVARLREATWAFRSWALGHPAEFGLVFGTPVAGYAAPEDGPTTAASQRFGAFFGGLFAELLAAGLLRTVDARTLTAGERESLRAFAARVGAPWGPGETYPFVEGYHRMLGSITVEVSGHLRWAFPDAEAFVRRQLDELLDDLLVTRPDRPASAPPS